LAVVVGFVGEHPFGGYLVSCRGDQDVADVGFFIAALIGVAENELDVVGWSNRLVPECRDGVASAMALTFGIEMGWADGIFDDRIVGEDGQPGFLVPSARRCAGTLAGQVCRRLTHCCHPE